MKAKTCRTCGEAKAIDKFYAQKNYSDGRRNLCKACEIKRRKEYSLTPKGKYCGYRNSARQRHHEWDLSFNQFIKLWQKPCTYCGAKIETIGIDRIFNDIGYIEGNIQPCCQTCNRAKFKMDEKDFLSWIERVYKKQIKE